MHRIALATALATVAACGGGAGETATVVLEGADGRTTLAVEVADSEDERREGLMGREELPADSGMVFLFDEPTTSTFTMRDTLIPLSIAFADANGRIVRVLDMEPCREEPCPSYAADEPYTAALEVNRGQLDRWGVEPGDQLHVESGEG
jgi:uncharacterized membrane protein (UPF0127 family)